MELGVPGAFVQSCGCGGCDDDPHITISNLTGSGRSEAQDLLKNHLRRGFFGMVSRTHASERTVKAQVQATGDLSPVSVA